MIHDVIQTSPATKKLVLHNYSTKIDIFIVEESSGVFFSSVFTPEMNESLRVCLHYTVSREREEMSLN